MTIDITAPTAPPRAAVLDLASFIIDSQGEAGVGVMLSEEQIIEHMSGKGWKLGDIMTTIAFLDEAGLGQEVGG